VNKSQDELFQDPLYPTVEPSEIILLSIKSTSKSPHEDNQNYADNQQE